MNRSTKGALAAVAAGLVLLGGRGSLAYWSDTGTANGGSIDTGSLALSDGTCDTSWVYAAGASAGSAVSTLVPGDSITKDCSFTITATGDHLSATLSTPSSVSVNVTSSPAPTTLSLDVAATYQLGGGAVHSVTSADDGSTLVATFVVTMPFGNASTTNANDTQLLSASLDALTVTLTQDQTTDNPS